MPRLLIDITRLLYRRVTWRLPTGIDRVGLKYLAHYADRAQAVLSLGSVSVVLSPADSGRAFEVLLDPEREARLLSALLSAKSLLWARRPCDVTGAVLFNTGHTGLENPDYARALRAAGVLPVFLVHDLIPLSHPEYCRPGEQKRHLVRMRNAVTLARGVVTNSCDTLEALARFAAGLGLRVPCAVVAPLAPGFAPSAPGLRPIAAPYFVVLGTIEPRKNHWMVLQIWRRLVERAAAKAPRLVVIGQRGWECENVVDLLERSQELRGFVIEANACSDAELVTYLRHAQALLFPSFAEGYGLPIIEALSLGVPVIASDLPVFREIAGEVPEYIDPLDGQRWMALISEYAEPESERRKAQLSRMASLRLTTWAQHFRVVDDFLGELERQPGA
jgi:glycosyltransferase involved in cell wall biosynthesis